ncbi:MAG TPA: peptide deformylase, partial [Candidatus Sulfotelmatobacter sp.]|nr:peptide deformylase [Candidatus Sulfotelmatobacter sp.]
KRAQRVVAKGLNRHGKLIRIKGDGLLARAIQHEIDHLDGILFTDKLTSIDTLRPIRPEVDGDDEEDEDTLKAEESAEVVLGV